MNEFNAIYDKNKDSLLSFIRLIMYKHCVTSVEAMDVLQETFTRYYVSVHLKQAYDKSRAKEFTLLCMIAKNYIIDLARSKSSHQLEVDTESLYYEHNLEKIHLVEAVRQAISELPEKQHKVAVMFFYENHKLETISQSLDIPLNSVKVYVHRVRENLKLKFSLSL